MVGRGLLFFGWEKFGKRMSGATKFMCMIDSDDCIAVESYMGAQDIEKILTVLEQLSTQFNLDWDLSLEGENSGIIQAGKRDDQANQLIAFMHAEALEEFEAVGVAPEAINRESFLARFSDR